MLRRHLRGIIFKQRLMGSNKTDASNVETKKLTKTVCERLMKIIECPEANINLSNNKIIYSNIWNIVLYVSMFFVCIFFTDVSVEIYVA